MMNNTSGEMLELEKCRSAVEQRLSGYFLYAKEPGYSKLLESMRYSLLAGGKRIRAVICIKFCEAVGGAPETAMEAACAIEMLHAYSLIHDDLPCMDDDDMRRGKPSNHIQFGEFTATLAGDALQAAAFETLLGSALPPGRVVEMAGILAEAAGPRGICGGQYLDMSGDSGLLSLGDIAKMYELKTGALITASARIGVVAGGGMAEQAGAAEQYARKLAYAFQIRDDVLDCTASTGVLGKPVGSDRDNNKMTFASALPLKICGDLVESLTNEAIGALSGKFGDSSFLEWLASYLAERKY